MLCSSSTALNQYLDVFSAGGSDTLVLFRVRPGGNSILNPMIIIYTSERSEVYIGGTMVLNGSGKLTLNITVSQRVNIYNSYQNLTFWAEKVTNDPIYEQANFINEDMVNIAFTSGYVQALLGAFLLSPVVALLIRRSRL